MALKKAPVPVEPLREPPRIRLDPGPLIVSWPVVVIAPARVTPVPLMLITPEPEMFWRGSHFKPGGLMRLVSSIAYLYSCV